jgi:MFS transporter, ACS family, pantothenate transporter
VNLKNNIPTNLMRTRFHDWNTDTQDYVGHQLVLNYIRGFAHTYGLEKFIAYNTRAENVVKRGSKWAVRTWTFRKDHGSKAHYSVQERVREKRNISYRMILTIRKYFDGVVVATGHYSAPKVPDIPGLSEWKKAWPLRVIHAKSYRNPEEYKDQVRTRIQEQDQGYAF